MNPPTVAPPPKSPTLPHMTKPLPDDLLALAIVAKQLGWQPSWARRFNTGLDFFVFDVGDGTHNVVVRIGRPEQAGVLVKGTSLRQRLRALRVPLPETLASGTAAGFPFVIQTRLDGTDLGNVMHRLDTPNLERIATAVAEAQAATARLGKGTRYGYAATAQDAPQATWADVVDAHIGRSERRLAGTGLFPDGILQRVRSRFSRHATALAQMPSVPFLHDTTTKNVIVSPAGEFSGIVDVDDLCFGDPRYAPALTEVAMLVHGGPLGYVRTWMDRARHVRDAVFGFYVSVFMLDFMSEHATTFNGNEAVTRAEDRTRLADLLERSLVD